MADQTNEAGDDENLIEILGMLASNAEATAAQEPELLDYLNKVDGGFRHIFHGAPVAQVEPRHELLISCHQSYIAATRVALAGQVVQMLPLLRFALEGALYSYLLFADNTLTDVWLHRHRDERSRRDSRERIGASQALNALRQKDPDLWQRCKQQYEATITFGAHPLVLAVTPHRVTIRRSEHADEVGLAYFYKAGGPQVLDALVACADIGITCLLLSAKALPDHPPAVEADQMAVGIGSSLYDLLRLRRGAKQEKE